MTYSGKPKQEPRTSFLPCLGSSQPGPPQRLEAVVQQAAGPLPGVSLCACQPTRPLPRILRCPLLLSLSHVYLTKTLSAHPPGSGMGSSHCLPLSSWKCPPPPAPPGQGMGQKHLLSGQCLKLGSDQKGTDQGSPGVSGGAVAGKSHQYLPQRGKRIFQHVPFVSSSGDKVPPKCQSELRSNEGLF